MSREPIPTWYFALVVVRLGHRFLLVHERKHGQLWYLPAGRIEPGESFIAGACRETLEEAGIPIVVEGILRIEHAWRSDGTARCRVIFVARPKDDTPPKTVADAESLRGALGLDRRPGSPCPARSRSADPLRVCGWRWRALSRVLARHRRGIRCRDGQSDFQPDGGNAKPTSTDAKCPPAASPGRAKRNPWKSWQPRSASVSRSAWVSTHSATMSKPMSRQSVTTEPTSLRFIGSTCPRPEISGAVELDDLEARAARSSTTPA